MSKQNLQIISSTNRNPSKTSVCAKCSKRKRRSMFLHNPKRKAGMFPICRTCRSGDGLGSKKRYTEAGAEECRARTRDYWLRYAKENPLKIKARNLTKKYIRHGKLARLKCEVCGAENSQVHHLNYSKPMKIQWLCPRHHREAHRKNFLPRLLETCHRSRDLRPVPALCDPQGLGEPLVGGRR